MTGTFGSLNTALSALRYQQVALDVANNNIANVNTAGYVRRRAEAASVGATGQPTMWSQYDGHGDGVRVASVDRLADPLLDARSRRENGTLSYLSTQQTILNRVETSIGEPGDNGLSAALQELGAAFQDLVGDPAGAAARKTVLAKADAVTSAFKTQSDSIAGEIADQQSHASTVVQEVNDAATELARLNKTIKVAQVNNTDVGTLSDQRDLLALSLAKLTGAEVSVQPDGQFNVAVNGVALVTGDTAATMTATSGTPVALSVGGTAVPAGVGGELGGVVDVLNTTLPAYKKSLDDIATKFAAQMNAQHRAGTDLNGNPGQDLFTIDPADPAGSLAVAFTNTDLLAASAGGAKDGGNADALSRATTVGSDYAALVTSFGSAVASVNRQTTNQQTLTNQVDDEREQMAGVNLDEETVNMVAAQHAYEAASKMLTVMDSILDTLINRTGVTH
ncbi:flagellar hook-associated protein FlgK [Nocardioides panacihumi]|uniref:Flagellar hook-associated protein 1 n=1 Tax=Nocardioides panacihumi TaxID=400774 RepID=A0ABP5C7A0_9ACTN